MNLEKLERDLWEAADNLRANSKLTAAQYAMPVLGLIFLRHADNRFKAYLPEIENHLHYRSVDVSSVKELAKRWYPRRLAARPHKTGSHRALDDIRESVAELAFYRQMCFMPPESAESAVVDGPAASGVPPRP